MKDIIARGIAIIILGTAIFGLVQGVKYLIEVSERNEQIQKERCQKKDGVWNDAYSYCETKYEKCLKTVRTAFEDLTDTMGASQNNEDSVSKTMEREISRCLEKI